MSGPGAPLGELHGHSCPALQAFDAQLPQPVFEADHLQKIAALGRQRSEAVLKFFFQLPDGLRAQTAGKAPVQSQALLESGT